MEMPLNGFWGCPVEGADEAIATSGRLAGKLRMYTVKVTESEEILCDVAEGSGWQDPLPENVRWMSATAFFFARRLQEVLDVPVGILSFARGGSRVESWLPKTPDGTKRAASFPRIRAVSSSSFITVSSSP